MAAISPVAKSDADPLRRILLEATLYWVPLAVGLTVLSALTYVAVQQNFRQGANDPQIQMSEDAAAQLGAGQQPQAVVGGAKVDMSRSLAPFMIVYDEAGNILTSSAQLAGRTPELPPGVLSAARSDESGQNRLTWQPQTGVRIASVVTYYGGSKPGFVLAGRSLREVEDRVSRLGTTVVPAWAAALFGSFAAGVFALFIRSKMAL